MQKNKICELGTQTANTHELLIIPTIRTVPRLTRASSDRSVSKLRRFASFPPRNRLFPETHQEGALDHSSHSPDEFPCYSKVSDEMGLSIGLLSTLSAIGRQIFSYPKLSKLPLIFLHDFHTETHGSRDLLFSLSFFLSHWASSMIECLRAYLATLWRRRVLLVDR